MTLEMYIIESGLCLMVFYSIYAMLLRNDTFHMLNRSYLMTTVLISFIIPVIEFTAPASAPVINGDMATSVIIVTAKDVGQNLSIAHLVRYMYLGGVLLMLVRIIAESLYILYLRLQSEKRALPGINIYIVNRALRPFSFLGHIFVSRNTFESSAFNDIIEHEKAHIKQFHSIDILIIEVLAALQWFNPAIWMYRKSVASVHEYLADSSVLNSGCEVENYSRLILDQVFDSRGLDIANNFGSSPIKRRIYMMTKIKSGPVARAKLFLMLPIAALLIAAFSFEYAEADKPKKDKQNTEKQASTKQKSGQKNQKLVGQNEKDEFIELNENPKIDMRDAQSKLKYPAKAKEKGLSGKVFVKVFVDKEGNPTKVEVVESDHKEFEEMAIAAIKETKFEPAVDKDGVKVACWITVPLHFKLK